MSRKVVPFGVLLVTLAAFLPVLAAEDVKAPTGPDLKTDDEKIIYAVGLAISESVSQFRLSEAELDILKAGLTDGVTGREKKVDLNTYGPRIQGFARARIMAAEKLVSGPFLEKAAAEPGAVKKPSGLIYKEITAGTGDSPKASDRVKVHYTGTLADGTVFDSSVQRGQPAEFALSGVIPCWTEGVQLMKVGGKSKLICPAEIAYGERGSPPKIRPGAALAFEVELIEIVKPQDPGGAKKEASEGAGKTEGK